MRRGRGRGGGRGSVLEEAEEPHTDADVWARMHPSVTQSGKDH